MSDMRIAVLGAAGRMGQALTRVLVETPGCTVAGGIEAKDSPAVGQDIGTVAGLEPLSVAITDDPLPVFAHVDGVLDFTSPASTVE
ncbi:MAG TPA: 4-hydroxy-tetrahydrodipicolinate reductase, partial [Methyloceanibacter sp.]|nr:4-hydroxy-tetrahydrodipicolinate reductase [Methyloceanibacter sp.]